MCSDWPPKISHPGLETIVDRVLGHTRKTALQNYEDYDKAKGGRAVSRLLTMTLGVSELRMFQ